MAFSLAVDDSCQAHARLHPRVPPLKTNATATISRIRVVVAVWIHLECDKLQLMGADILKVQLLKMIYIGSIFSG